MLAAVVWSICFVACVRCADARATEVVVHVTASMCLGGFVWLFWNFASGHILAARWWFRARSRTR